jgi:hypothetical protein
MTLDIGSNRPLTLPGFARQVDGGAQELLAPLPHSRLRRAGGVPQLLALRLEAGTPRLVVVRAAGVGAVRGDVVEEPAQRNGPV